MKFLRTLGGSKIQMNFPRPKPRAAALYDMALGLLNHLDLSSLLERVVIEAAKLVKTKHGYYNLVELESDQMIRKVGIGIYQNDVHRVMSLKRGLIQQTIETGEITIRDDYNGISSGLSAPSFDKVCTEIQIPIKIESKVVGVVGLSLIESSRIFTRAEREVLQQFAAIASVGMQNATLYSAVQRESEERRKNLEADYQAIVSERELAKERIYYLVNFDELTKLPNRTLFNDRLHIALAHGKRNREKLAVLFFDLDRFKTINDSLGYHIGDIILQEVAERLKLCIRDEDTLCRMGADEFVILLTDIEQLSNITKIVSRMIAALSMPCIIGEVELRITSSIGIAFYPDNGHTPEILVRHAELAMYHAKNNGRNNYQFFTESLNHVVTERLSLENSLRLAIERNEFVLYYQPQINIRTNKLIGVEALIRWNHPQNGLVSPVKFISIAEETGLIIPIGEWVLREVCRQHLNWIEFGLPAIQIAVNVSAIQFQEKQFRLTLQEIIKNGHIDPAYLELELTEGIVMKDASLTIKELHLLKDLGVNLSIDDFGTGYSSLQYFSKFPIDKLKIDQSFIKAMMVDPSSLAIVETIISLAEKLQIKVIAEGVETKEEANKIGQCGCEEVQGYYFSKPLPAHEFIEWYYDKL